MRNLFTAMTGAALLTLSAATHANDGLYLGPSLSAYHLDSERNVQGSDEPINLGVNLGYRWGERWALEAGVNNAAFGDTDDFETYSLDGYVWLRTEKDRFNPYLVAELSQFERDDPTMRADEGTTRQVGVGFGVSKMISDHWDYRADARVHAKVDGGVSNTMDLSFNVGVNYYFNEPATEQVAQAEPEPEPQPEPQPEPEPEYRTITVELRVLFEFDKAVVREIYGDELQAVARAMKQHEDIELLLEGHTDSVGTDEYNQDLSQRRAAAVEEKLADEYGIDRKRIDTVGYGESRPVADNSSEEGRRKNRRVIGEVTYEEVVTD